MVVDTTNTIIALYQDYNMLVTRIEILSIMYNTGNYNNIIIIIYYSISISIENTDSIIHYCTYNIIVML
jgi:hypothetical protein